MDYTYFLSEHLQTLVKNLWNVIQHILMEKKELAGGGERKGWVEGDYKGTYDK